MEDRYSRWPIVVGMTSLVRRARAKPDSVDPRIATMPARKPARVGRNRRGSQSNSASGGRSWPGGASIARPIGAQQKFSRSSKTSFRRLRARCEMMANRSYRELGHLAECQRRQSLQGRVGTARGYHQGQRSLNDRIDKPDIRLHPTRPPALHHHLQRGTQDIPRTARDIRFHLVAQRPPRVGRDHRDNRISFS